MSSDQDSRPRESPLAPDAVHPAEKLLRWIERKDLQAPAAAILEMHRPLMPLAWSVAMLAGGVLAPLFGADYYQKIQALRDPEFLDRLLARLEASGRKDKAG